MKNWKEFKICLQINYEKMFDDCRKSILKSICFQMIPSLVVKWNTILSIKIVAVENSKQFFIYGKFPE
jgi:hypothetical protein